MKDSNNRTVHSRNNTITKVSKKRLFRPSMDFVNNAAKKAAPKKSLLNKKVVERKVKSQCTANRTPVVFPDITIE